MKLRIHGNSLRLRLNRAEVAQFGETGRVQENIEFGPGASLAYALESSTDLQTPQAIYQNGALKIRMPRSAANDWVRNDQVSVSGEQALGPGKHLSILIEKDFKCIHGGHEPDPEAYPNPLAPLGTGD